MCLAVPARVVDVELGGEADVRMGRVELLGVRRRVCLEHVPDVRVGDHVLVHVGFALCKLDPDEAASILQTLGELAALEEA
jgi:hydrogenase expression/formation protein HypC